MRTILFRCYSDPNTHDLLRRNTIALKSDPARPRSPMTTQELIIGIAALVLPVLTYFAGVYRTERRYSREQSETRISRVLGTYIDMSRSLTSKGFHALIKAGVSTLESNQEVRTLLTQITQHGENNPLGKHQELLHEVDLHVFFETARELEYDFIHKGTPEKVVRQMGNRS